MSDKEMNTSFTFIQESPKEEQILTPKKNMMMQKKINMMASQ